MASKIGRWIKNNIKKGINFLGYDITLLSQKPDNKLEYWQEAKQAISMVKQNTMLSDLKLATLYEQVIYCEKNNIEGDYVECGVWKGGAVGIIATANLKYGQQRRHIHLFDSFDDICEPITEIDGKQAMKDIESLYGRKVDNYKGELKPLSGIYDSRGGHGTIETCKELIVEKIRYPKEYLYFHEGWFQETLPIVAPVLKKIALLRLDADWYTSTKICLEYLFDKVVIGGIIIIDDYGRYDGCKKAVDEFLVTKHQTVLLNYADYQDGECRFFIKIA